MQRPGATPHTTRTPRVIAARKLHRRRDRDDAGLFLVEGPQAVREARGVVELFGTAEALDRYAATVAAHPHARVSPVTEDALAVLAETVNPQGLVAVCRQLHVTEIPDATRLAVVPAGIADPGNAGTVLRTADAAGADLVVFPEGTVDPYNGKCVRASAGSLFHLTVVRGGEPLAAVETLRAAGLRVLAADADGETLLDDLRLHAGTVWIFGSEAHGLDPRVAAAADARVRIPIYGKAESLNLAAAAAICLYATARSVD